MTYSICSILTKLPLFPHAPCQCLSPRCIDCLCNTGDMQSAHMSWFALADYQDSSTRDEAFGASVNFVIYSNLVSKK
jgi:hypothetical protein